MPDLKFYFVDSINKLYLCVPTSIYVVLLLLLVLGTLVFFVSKGIKHKGRAICRLILVEFIFFLYCSTVLFRPINEGAAFDFRPFWSYGAILERKSAVLIEILLNVAMFVPVGILLGAAFTKIKCKHVLLAVVSLSVSIEVLQLVLKRGFAEFDDVFHNVIGCLIGFGIYKLVYIVSKRTLLKGC